MDATTLDLLRALLATQDLASLATLHGDRDDVEPAVSMVPLAWLPATGDALIHISALAAHTRDLQRAPRAGLMLTAPRQPGDDPLALPRLTLRADAEPIDAATPDLEAARAAYRARFPGAEQTFALGDFALWRLRPRTARLVAGFGRAHAVPLPVLHATLKHAADIVAAGRAGPREG